MDSSHAQPPVCNIPNLSVQVWTDEVGSVAAGKDTQEPE